MTTFYTAPAPPAEVILNPSYGLFSVIVPEGTTNLCTNPSFETNTTGYSTSGSAGIARSAAQQRRGAYGLAVTPDGFTNPTGVVYTFTPSVTAPHTLSCDLLGAPGHTYRLCWRGPGAAFNDTPVAQTQLQIDPAYAGRWVRLSVTYSGATSGLSYTLYLERISPLAPTIYYTDGWQIEALPYATTYCDGDERGLVVSAAPAYRWTGTPHASTSVRSGQARGGGRLKDLQNDYGLMLTGYSGLGLEAPEHTIQPYALQDGGQYQRSLNPSRTFELRGTFYGDTFQNLRRLRGALGQAVQIGRTTPQQPLILRYQALDNCGNPVSEPVDIPCLYAGGLPQDTSNAVAEQVVIRFLMPRPDLRLAGEAGAALDFTDALGASIFSVESVGGRWQKLSIAFPTAIRDAVYDPNGPNLYSAGDDGSGDGIVYAYDTSAGTSSALGGGAAFDSGVYTVAVGANGDVYVGGLFTTNVPGSVTYNYVARWDVVALAWQQMSTGIAAASLVNVMRVGPDGTVYAATDGAGVRAWDGSAWSAVGGLGDVPALTIGIDGALYAYDAAASIAYRWNGSSWVNIGAVAGGDINSLATGVGGRIYAVGDFTSVDGVSAAGAAVYNGTGWEPLGTGLSGGTVRALKAAVQPVTGELYVTGDFTSAGGITLPDRVAIWNGSFWRALDLDLAGTSAFEGLATRADGRVYLGARVASGDTSGLVTVTNEGTAPAAPVFKITGPGTIWQIYNVTTGALLAFTNLTLLAGETLTVDLTPSNRIESSFRGSLVGKVAPGGPTAWRLVPGANQITAFITGSTSDTAAALRYRPAFASLDDATE